MQNERSSKKFESVDIVQKARRSEKTATTTPTNEAVDVAVVAAEVVAAEGGDAVGALQVKEEAAGPGRPPLAQPGAAGVTWKLWNTLPEEEEVQVFPTKPR